MAEPEKPPNPAAAVGPPAADIAASPPPNPSPGDAAAAGAPTALAAPPAEGGAPAAEGAPAASPAEGGAPVADGAPAEPASPPELSPEEREAIEKERIRVEEEAKQRELERMWLEDLRIREMEKQRPEEEEAGNQIVSAARLRMLAEFENEQIHLMRQESLELQKRVVALQKKRKSVNAEEFILEGQDAYYYARLTKWNDTKYEFSKMKDDLDKKIDNLRNKLEAKTEEANARHEGLIHYLWKVARDSQDIVSFQRIPNRVLHELKQAERDSIAELQAVRTRGRMLKKQLAKLELRLALKDQLQLDTGNLLLVDYDQLKIENESLHQKIQMKNEALSTLKKKTAFLVHTLQHIREKVQFLVVECKEKGQELADDDKALHGGRIKNSLIKTSIVNINRKRDAITRGVVYIKLPIIWDDMDYQREDIETEVQTFRDLKKHYHNLTMKIEELKNCLYGLKALPFREKKRFTKAPPPSPPLERGLLRWGTPMSWAK